MGSSKKHKEKDKDRDKEEKRHKHKHKDKDKDRERERDRDRKERRHKRDRSRSRSKERRKRRRSRSPSQEDVSRAKQEKAVDTPREEPTKNAAESLSIEEANKVRIKLGLKPLDVSSDQKGEEKEGKEEGDESTSKKEDVHAPAINLGVKKKQDTIREKLALLKETRKQNKKLGQVKTLGEVDEDDDAVAWVWKSRQKEKEKAMAEKRAKLLEEMDEEFGIGDLVEDVFGSENARKQEVYSSKNLSGMKVEHSKETFVEGKNVVLTLKDSNILEDEGDTLVNVNIIDDEKASANVDLKKKTPGYKPYEEPEMDELGRVKPKSLLSKYDEEIEGAQKSSFTLDREGAVDLEGERDMLMVRRKLMAQGVSLDTAALAPARDYYSAREMESFKKSTKRRRKIRKLKADDLLPDQSGMDHGSRDSGKRKVKVEEGSEGRGDLQSSSQAMDMDLDLPNPEPSKILGRAYDYTPVVEDEGYLDLENALKKSRKLRQKRERVAGAQRVVEEVAKMADSKPATSKMAASIELNSTSEFCRALGELPSYGGAGNREEGGKEEGMDFEEVPETPGTASVASKVARDPLLRGPTAEEAQQGWSAVKFEEEEGHTEAEMEEDVAILDDEPKMNAGLASALLLASNKGYIHEGEPTKRAAEGQGDASDLAATNFRVEDKSYTDIDAKFSKHDHYKGPITDFKEKASYQPGFRLEYADETGRLLTTKEAFRQLSHRFHGKGSGKNKTEKRSKKINESQMMQKMSSTDTPLNTVAMLQEKQRVLQSPYLVLSGGSKTLTANTITKPK